MIAEIVTENPGTIGGLLVLIGILVRYIVKAAEKWTAKVDELIKNISEMREAQVRANVAMEAIAKSTTDLGKTLEKHMADTKVHVK